MTVQYTLHVMSHNGESTPVARGNEKLMFPVLCGIGIIPYIAQVKASLIAHISLDLAWP
jgi:hypothetical protein